MSFRANALFNSAFRCALADEECDGRLEAHHLIPQQTLKRLAQRGDLKIDLDAALDDGRNGIGLCKAHHHQVTVSATRLSRDDLPETVEAFAEAAGCGAELDRFFGPSNDPDRPVAKPAERQHGQLRQRLVNL